MGLFSGLFGSKPKEGKYDKKTENLTNMLQARAEGKGPSVSGEQATNAMGKNVANTMGTIKASGGINNALKAKMLSRAGERVGTDIARASALGKAQEQIGAQNSLGGILSNASQLENQKEQAAQSQKNSLLKGAAKLGICSVLLGVRPATGGPRYACTEPSVVNGGSLSNPE